jgi:dephospho-CoA kinase
VVGTVRSVMVGLTGGVGSGKSTVSALLTDHGAVVVDADAIAREVLEPGTPGFDSVVARFGRGVVAVDGALDRKAIAAVVFADQVARNDLNAIVHPLVGERSQELIATVPRDSIVVYDVPLLVEGGLESDFDCVVVVEADTRTRLARLAARGLPEDEARARMAAQATDEQRRAVAHELISNGGSREQLADEVSGLWHRLLARRDAPAGRRL